MSRRVQTKPNAWIARRRAAVTVCIGLGLLGAVIGEEKPDVALRNEDPGVQGVAPPADGGVLLVVIEGVIDLGLAPFIERVVEEAETTGAAAIFLDINTLGGRVDAAIRIRDALIDTPVHTIAFVDPRAISAGALISLACKTIAMSPGGSIGAATPVTGAGTEKVEAAGEKMVSYWRSEMRATAERHGRRGDLAEAMVDRDMAIDGVIDEGKLLTLTTTRALDLGLADFEASGRHDVLEQLGLGDRSIEERATNWAERVARVVSHPALSSMLLSLGFLGLLIELYHPGWGLPGTFGLIALALFFLGHYVVRLAGFEEMLLFGLGVVLLGIEVFVVPGFGFLGVAGIGIMLVSVFLAMIGLDLRISWRLGLVTEALAAISGAMITVLVGSALIIRYVPASRLGRVLILRRDVGAGAGFTSHDAAREETYPLGTRASAVGDLRPAGPIRIDGRRIDAVSEGGYIERGTGVVLVAWRGGTAVVRPEDAGTAADRPADDA